MPPTSQPQSQTQYMITPWRHPNDLLTVRNNLYTPSTPEDQAHAIATVTAWKLRGNVPHAVESTALLFDAMLFHARSTGSLPPSSSSSSSADSSSSTATSQPPFPPSYSANSFALRAAYTTALSRFVTGFADLGRHKGGIGQSMFDVARTIALPPHFVELRHEVAHEEMPGLARLVRSSREAVQWLWSVYWGRLEESSTALGEASLPSRGKGDSLDLGLGVGEVREKVGVSLREFKSQRVARLKSGKGRKMAKEEIKAASDECVRLCHGDNSRERWEEVVEVFIDDGLIIPSLKQRGPLPDSALGGAYILWDELLLHLAQKSDDFADVLLEKCVAHVAAFTTTDSDQDANDTAKWAVYRWMMHVLYSNEWQGAREALGDDWKNLVIQECSLFSNSLWSQKIANELQVDIDENGEGDGLDDMDAKAATDQTDSEMAVEDAGWRRGGWRQAVGEWKALPIGVVKG